MATEGNIKLTKDAKYWDLVKREHITLAMQTKMDAVVSWIGANSWEEALNIVRNRINWQNITIPQGIFDPRRFSEPFYPENEALNAIASMAEILPDKRDDFRARLFHQFYNETAFSDDIVRKISFVFENNPEQKIVNILKRIHISWIITQADKFEMYDEKNNKARNKEYQFDNLLLMQFGGDGASADKVFTNAIIDSINRRRRESKKKQILIPDEKLRREFISQQKDYIRRIMLDFGEKGKIPFEEALRRYLQSGGFITLCGKIARFPEEEEKAPITTTATAIKIDPSRSDDQGKWRSQDRIPIKKLLREDKKVVFNMSNQILAQLARNGINLETLTSEFNGEHTPADDGKEEI